MPETEDSAILKDIAEGKMEAFVLFYRRHADRVYNTALTYLQRPADAEEVTQDVFTKIWRNAAKFKGNSQVTTWIYRIVVNTSLTAAKKRDRGTWLRLAGPPARTIEFDHPGSLLENRESDRALFKAIYALPPRQKTAFVLSYVEELPRQQVADVMGLSLKAVEGLLMRGKKQLRGKLEKEFPNQKK